MNSAIAGLDEHGAWQAAVSRAASEEGRMSQTATAPHIDLNDSGIGDYRSTLSEKLSKAKALAESGVGRVEEQAVRLALRQVIDPEMGINIVDLGLVYEVDLPIEFIGAFDTTLAKEFMAAFAMNAGITLHIHSLSGENSHHIVEAAFKAVARALKEAVSIDERCTDVPSTKGQL